MTLIPMPVLSNRAIGVLHEHQVNTLEDLTRVPLAEARTWDGLSAKAIQGLSMSLKQAGLTWLQPPKGTLDPKERAIRDVWAKVWREVQHATYRWDLARGSNSADAKAAGKIAAMVSPDDFEPIARRYQDGAQSQWPHEPPTLGGLVKFWSRWANQAAPKIQELTGHQRLAAIAAEIDAGRLTR